MDLAHGFILVIDLTLGEHLQILGERPGVCTKVAFAIENQRYISETKQSRAKVTRVRPIDWWQIWCPSV